jgi:hypothetical protein
MPKRSDVRALKNMIDQSYLIVSSEPVPPGGIERCRELLSAARLLAKDLLTTPTSVPAALLGAKGGKATLAKRGPDYFRKLASKRKTFGGGRPPKSSDE